jgi:E3 SUMO-protein ligase RanBP2
MTQSQSANNFGKIQFGTTATASAAPIIFGSKETVASSGQTKGLFDFSSKITGFTAPPTTIPDSKSTTAAPILFGSTNTPKADTIFGQRAGSSFAELASSSQPLGFGGGFKASPAPNAFMLFGAGQQPSSKTADGEEGEEGDNQNPEEYEPQVDFKPLVKLAEVEVKTGEEDEDVVFKARCKLYRFSIDTKEWKEKGAGEIKILKHKTNSNSYRVLMRRDQIFKICANHRILPEIKLEILNEKQVRWMANDCSEGKVNSECLTAKFRHEDEAKQFKAEFEKAQEAVKNQTPGVKQESVKTTTTMNNLNSLASSLKISSGSWNCESCLSTNKPESKKCASCDQVRVDKNSTNNDNGKIKF